MYENLARFFNSEQWRGIRIEQLLKEYERVIKNTEASRTKEANDAVLAIYEAACNIIRNTPDMTVEEAMNLISFKMESEWKMENEEERIKRILEGDTG